MTSYTTETGRILTDADVDAIVAEVESAEYDVEALRTRRGVAAPPWVRSAGARGKEPHDVTAA